MFRPKERVDAAYKERDGWDRKAITNVGAGREVLLRPHDYEYASEIWHVEPCEVAPM